MEVSATLELILESLSEPKQTDILTESLGKFENCTLYKKCLFLSHFSNCIVNNLINRTDSIQKKIFSIESNFNVLKFLAEKFTHKNFRCNAPARQTGKIQNPVKNEKVTLAKFCEF